jgi:hypothetical protein
MMNNLLGSVAASGGRAVVVVVNTPHRYWRFKIDSSRVTQDYARFAELRLYETADASAVSIASQATVTNGSSYLGNNGSNVADGNDDTYWYSRSAGWDDKWIAFDFGAGNAKHIEDFELTEYLLDGNYTPVNARLQWSDDGVTYTDRTTIVCPNSGTNNRYRFNKAGVYKRVVDATKKRFWRIRVTSSHSIAGTWQPAYFAAYDTLGGANLITDAAKLWSYNGRAASADYAVLLGAEGENYVSLPTNYASIGYDFGVGANVDIKEITIGKRSLGSAQAFYTGNAYYAQYSNDGLTWETAWSGNFITPWANGFVTQSVFKPT